MFYRPIVLLFAVSTVLITRLDNVSAIAQATPQADYASELPYVAHAPELTYESELAYGAQPYYDAPPTNYGNPYGSGEAPNYHVDSNVIYHSNDIPYETAGTYGTSSGIPNHPALDTDNHSLLQYRRMMLDNPAPQPHELQGKWRGINKGIATLAIDKRFIKEFQCVDCQVYGDNIIVHQGSGDWVPIQDHQTGSSQRQGKFLVQRARGIGPFRNAVTLNYSKGGNQKLDPANLISDRLVKLDDNHMLGRATAKFGPIEIPLAYFVLQRVPE